MLGLVVVVSIFCWFCRWFGFLDCVLWLGFSGCCSCALAWLAFVSGLAHWWLLSVFLGSGWVFCGLFDLVGFAA